MQGKRVLVTGAGGFIGRWSVAPLLQRGYEVHAVLSANAADRVPREIRGATVHFADLHESSAVESLVSAIMPAQLLHFAWIATPGLYWNSQENFRWVAASENLMRSFRAHGGSRALLAGSCAEYDWSQTAVCDERLSPLAHAASPPYVVCKNTLQNWLADFGRREHLSTAWGRIFLQFGPYEHPDRLVPSLIRNLLLNREAPMSHGRQIRAFLHAADVAGAFVAVLDSELEGVVNIGSAERTSLADLADLIARQIGRPDLLRVGARAAPADEPPLLVPETYRLRDEARWRPRFTLDEGISDTIAWWRSNLQGAGDAAR